jgi:serine/threonine-protein kinase
MKPANIMIDRDSNVKLVDFGIAKVLQPGQRNTMVGTPGYSPPEQYQGLATRESDLYALAATLHHLLTGRDPRDHPPFTFPLVTSLRPEVSLQTTKALDKALSMEVKERFPTVEAFRRALPIPTGDRRPTLPFDLPREAPQPAREQAAPAVPVPAPQRAAPEARQRQRVPQPAPARGDKRRTAPPQPRPAAKRPRRGVGRTVRRVVAAALLAAGVAGAGVTLYPQVEPMLRNLVTQPAPVEPAQEPSTNFVVQTFQTEVSVTLPEGSSNSTILSALRSQYAVVAQNQYQGARVNPSIPIAVVGGQWQAGVPTNGEVVYTAQMSGSLLVPQ